MTDARSPADEVGDDQGRKLHERRRYDERARRVRGGAYDWTSGAERVNPALRWPYRHLEAWLAARCPGRRVLDFGCGHGLFGIHPARCGAEVVGVDISCDSLAVARGRAEREGVRDRASFGAGDCERLPFRDDAFDVVLSCGVLSCLVLDSAAAEIARVLRPGGEAIVVDTLGHNPWLNLRRALAARRGERTRWTTDHILTLADVERLRNRFAESRLHFFDFATVFAAPFAGIRRFAPLMDRLAALDRRLLAGGSPIRRYAFKVVVELSGPHKSLRRPAGAALEGRT